MINTDIGRYPRLTADIGRLKENLAVLCRYADDRGAAVCGVVKGFSALPQIAEIYAESGVRWLASSRIEQLAALRAAGINEKHLMLIRIPMLSELPDAVRVSDVSLHSDIGVLRAAEREAARQGKTHGVMLMQDLGDLREGFWNRDELLAAAIEVETEMPHLHLAGIGVNLSCYGSVIPSRDNLSALVQSAEEIERAIGRRLEWISGGESTSVKLLLSGDMPERINQLRIGEFALFGGIDGFFPDELYRDVFSLQAEVVECRDKPSFPVGERSVNAFGETKSYEDRGIRRRAIAAVGRADYAETDFIRPRMPDIEILGASSDHTILDVEEVRDGVRVGDILEFDVSYGALVHLTKSQTICLECKK